MWPPLFLVIMPLQRFAFILEHCITLTHEAEIENQTRSRVKVLQFERETL